MGVRRVAVVLAALVIAAAVSGCAGASPAVPATPRTGPQMLAAAITALDSVHSFRMHATGEDKHRARVVLDAEIILPGRITMTLTTSRQTTSVVALGPTVYVSGNAAFWAHRRVVPAAIQILSDRWVKVTAAHLSDRRFLRAMTQAPTLGRCMLGTRARIHLAPRPTTVAGQPAIELSEPGGRRGVVPARLYLAASGPPLPLRLTQTGPTPPGAHADRACGGSSGPDSITFHDVRFSDYNGAGDLFAPGPVINPKRALAHVAAQVRRAVEIQRSTGGLERAQARAMIGTWLSRGQITAAHGPIGEVAGAAILSRVWRIGQKCVGRACALYIVRTMAQGESAAPLLWTGRHWTARFVQTNLCPTGLATKMSSNWVVVLSGGRLSAFEHNRTGTECGQIGTSTVVWIAHRALTPPGARTLS